jgi:hypothetical protein
VEGGTFLDHVFVDVLDISKGELPTGYLLRVDTADNDAACEFPFVAGEEYVIFASFCSNHSGTLAANSCSPTGTISRPEAWDLFGPPVELDPLNVEFRRRDVDGHGEINIADPVANLIFQFLDRFEPSCHEALDFDNNDPIDLSDAVAGLQFLFLSGATPADPFMTCGKDPDLEPFDSVDCERYPLCPPRPVTNEIVHVEQRLMESKSRFSASGRSCRERSPPSSSGRRPSAGTLTTVA